MGILLFAISSLTSFYLLNVFLGSRRVNFFVLLIASVIVGFLTKSIGTYTGCADGWMSTNIGKQGACSHHGGVVTYINAYGTTALVACLFLSGIVLFVRYLKSRND